VKGQNYQNQTIDAGDQFFNVRIMRQAQETVNRYSIGAQVMVYYNPANSQRICARKIILCYNAATMKLQLRFANNNNDNDDLCIVGRSFAG